MKRTMLFLAAFLFSANLSNAQTGEIPKEVVDRVYPVVTNFVFAEFIAKNCRSIRLKPGAKRSTERWVLDRLKEAGRKERTLDGLLEKNAFRKRYSDDIFAWVEKHDITMSDRSTLCPAGQKMIANKDPVGHYIEMR